MVMSPIIYSFSKGKNRDNKKDSRLSKVRVFLRLADLWKIV